MSPRAWLLLAWILSGAEVLVVHAVVVWQVLRAPSAPRRARLWALLPLLAPLVAWKVGRRLSPILWALSVALYVALRLLERVL